MILFPESAGVKENRKFLSCKTSGGDSDHGVGCRTLWCVRARVLTFHLFPRPFLDCVAASFQGAILLFGLCSGVLQGAIFLFAPWVSRWQSVGCPTPCCHRRDQPLRHLVTHPRTRSRICGTPSHLGGRFLPDRPDRNGKNPTVRQANTKNFWLLRKSKEGTRPYSIFRESKENANPGQRCGGCCTPHIDTTFGNPTCYCFPAINYGTFVLEHHFRLERFG
jgi:hypothetical protein